MIIKRSAIALIVLLLLLLTTTQAWARDIRVLLESSTDKQLTVFIDSGEYEIKDDRGVYITSIRRNTEVEIENNRGELAVYVEGKLAIDGQSDVYLAALNDDCLFKYKNMLYRGSLRIVAYGSITYIIDLLDVEYYLYGVVGREIGNNQPLEAVKAQAVASRSVALAKIDPANKYYDIGSGILSQSYGGYSAEKEATAGNILLAVNATVGEVVCYRGQPFECYFHSNAGGHTEDLANVWSGRIPLKGVPSPYDDYVEKSGLSSNIYRWQVTYSAAELKDLAERYGGRGIGEYRGIELSTKGADGKASASGRVTEVTIKGSKGQVSAKRDDIRSLLGNLKSTLFALSASLNTIENISRDTTFYVLDKGQTTPQAVSDIGSYYVQDGSSGILNRLIDWGMNFTIKGANRIVNVGSGSAATPSSSSNAKIVTLYGKGYGHGVGMSQWGAIGMAADGYRYDEILSHYYNMEINRDFTLEKY
ncbi:MAG: SpoIID/LytB domain-containing protein [Firmicutes bacterium]|nr:SpoIID/LytB domain-containing protein [Bacillota bacterium]